MLSVASGSIPGYSYQILRLPRRIGNPLELSAGTCIDLAYSGIGPTNQPQLSLLTGMYPALATMTQATLFRLFPMSPQRLDTLAVMFAPGGGVDSIYLNNYWFSPQTTVHFLIGRADKLGDPLASDSSSSIGLAMYNPNISNLADPNALWVSVSRSTGNVVTSDNLPPAITGGTSTTAILSGGSVQQQTINPSITSGQITYLALCRQLATNREQIRGQ
jgi:hypothetical protein